MRRWMIAFAVVLAAMTLSGLGCSTDISMKFEQDGGTYTTTELDSFARGLPGPGFKGEAVASAPDLRHDVLVSLRSNSELGSELADLLGTMFPEDPRAVPYYAELATVGDEQVWVVVEVWGRAGGVLDQSRVWAIRRGSGEVVSSTVFE